MNYQTALLFLGALLLLVGLLGKVKVKEIDLGTSNKYTRAVSAILGIMLIIISFLSAGLIGKMNFTINEKKEESSKYEVNYQGEFIGDFTSSSNLGGVSTRTIIKKVEDKYIGKYSYAMKEGTIEGYIDKRTLFFQWQESGVYGKGVFHFKDGGKRFIGTWGYKESNDNGGTWNGFKEEVN